MHLRKVTCNTDSFRERATQGIYQGLLTFFDDQLKEL